MKNNWAVRSRLKPITRRNRAEPSLHGGRRSFWFGLQFRPQSSCVGGRLDRSAKPPKSCLGYVLDHHGAALKPFHVRQSQVHSGLEFLKQVCSVAEGEGVDNDAKQIDQPLAK